MFHTFGLTINLPTFQMIQHFHYFMHNIGKNCTQHLCLSTKLRANKAVYTTVSVVYGWAGAVMQFKSLFGVILRSVTDGTMDQRTDGPTE